MELLRTRRVQVPGERPDGVTGFSALSANGISVLDFYFDSGTVALCFDDRDPCSKAIAGEVITRRSADIDSIQNDPAVVTIIAVPPQIPASDREIDVDYWTNVELVSASPTWLSALSESSG